MPFPGSIRAHELGCPQANRPRVFCASLADVFEDWTGPMVAANGNPFWWCHGSLSNSPIPSVGLEDGCRMATMADIRERLFDLIDQTPNLDWLLLTKRPENIARMMPEIVCGGHDIVRPNLWLGVSVENQQAADERIPHLLRVPAAVRFLSCEPLLGPVDLTKLWLPDRSGYWNCLTGKLTARVKLDAGGELWAETEDAITGRIGWVIVGGESGTDARPMHPDWARSLRDQCQAAGVPFFFKQHGDWMAGDFMGRPDSRRDARPYRYVSYDGSTTSDNPESAPLSSYCVYRVGKRAAGRLL
ncbi:MAG: DUF5131 family protein, partial [Planctomycetia bacterium]|nr:DUF5131 family protein [Planctomycetia bacterium]